jgi:hypothetical protein
MYTKAFIPFKGYYSTPFCKWQGSMANENAISFAAAVSRQWLATRKLGADMFDYCIFGNTIGQHHQETVQAGGGWFLWTGCAAGDCGGALILKIS